MALELADQWAKVTPGINVLNFSGGRVQMTLAVGDVLPMLRNFDCSVDAVYLDGFSPKLNPEMWSPSTLEAVASHCYGGTRLATYTIAKSVRQTLQALGFEVKKCPGLPPKRDRLEGVFLPSHQ
jgi:tRNA 5-methylaminomethyl-2-thiouridine biosynthesis bifunctional protein